jgi:hypothetical protein
MFIDCDAVAAALDSGATVEEIEVDMREDFKEFLRIYREEEIKAAKIDILVEITMLLREYSLLSGNDIKKIAITDEMIAEMDKLLK